MSTALSADGVELKVGMKVRFCDQSTEWPVNEITAVPPNDEYGRVHVTDAYGQGGLYTPRVIYATEQGFLKNWLNNAHDILVEETAKLARYAVKVREAESRLAALTAGEPSNAQ